MALTQLQGGEYWNDPVETAPLPTSTAPNVGTNPPASPQPGPTAPTTNPWDAYAQHPFYTGISDAYQRYFGRTPGGNEVWDRLGQGQGLTQDNFLRQLQDIANSFQYADYRDRGAGYRPPTTTGATTGGGSQGFDWNTWDALTRQYGSGTVQDLDRLVREHPELGLQIVGGSRGDIRLPSGEVWDVIRSAGTGGTGWQRMQSSGGGSMVGGPGGGVFGDPATSEWEQLLRTINQRLQQPQPTYTPAQRELMQTQALDPLTRQRDAMRQQTVERFAARGINPGSGILEQALQDIDRQFSQMQTGQNTQFALNQIGREDQLFNSNEQRALAGLNLFSQIPQLADKRLQMAQGVLTPSNPYQLLTLQNQIAQQAQQQQQYNQGQNQEFARWLAEALYRSFYGNSDAD